MKRREFIATLSVAAAAWPVMGSAQQPSRVWRVGVLNERSDGLAPPAFKQHLRELGYVESKNLVIETRNSGGQSERLPGLAAELVNARIDVMVTVGSLTTAAAQKVTTTVPIVMTTIGDPVGSGFVKTLARPGGNITGLSNFATDLHPKHFELLLQISPKLTRIGFLINPEKAHQVAMLESLASDARKRGIIILRADARKPSEIDDVFANMAKQGAGAVIVSLDTLFNQQQRKVAELAVRYRLISISGRAGYADSGFLVGYGASTLDMFRRTADYVDKILKGAKPAELPVEQPTKFELAINRKTASALGLTIPHSLLISADKVIE